MSKQTKSLTDIKKEHTSTPCSPSQKPFSSQETYLTNLNHLVWMAKIPGAKIYAWGRAKELDKDPSGLFTGIAQDLVKEMKNG